MFFQNQLLVLPVLQLRLANYYENPWLSLLPHCHKLLQHQCCWKLLGLQAYIKETKKCPFWLKRKQSLCNLTDGAVLPSEARHESWICPIHQKSTINSKINWQWLGGMDFFLIVDCSNSMLLRFTSQSNFFTVYCILLPLSCSPFPTNDTRNTVFSGGRCGGTVIIWKGDKARSLGI